MVYVDPKWVIVEFLRHRLVDPRDRCEDPNTETFTANINQTSFSLSAPIGSVSCITSVTDNGSTMTKWQDYYIDFENEKIVFYSGRTSGNTIVIDYKYGSSNWIYPDKADSKLGDTSFPRINLLNVSGIGTRLGNYEAPIEGTLHIQLDVWSKEKKNNQVFTINNKKYSGDKLATYIAYKVVNAFEDYEVELHPLLYSFNLLQNPRDLPFNREYQCFHKVVEFGIRGVSLGNL